MSRTFPDPTPLYDAGSVQRQFAIIQGQLSQWVVYNFGDRPAWQCFMGVAEEVGELAHAHLKQEQGIRSEEDHEAKAKDAVADIVIFLLDYCNARGWQFGELLTSTLGEVLQRDWKAREAARE